MIEINYFEDYPNCFELSFCLSNYIPQKYFEINENGLRAELHFYIDLFKRNDLFIPQKGNAKVMVWSIHYSCSFDGVPFTMVYDKDYDFITFASEPEHKKQIAEYIKHLVELQKSTPD